MPTAADLSFFNRTVDVSPSGLLRERLDARSIVRMWGQRNTVHVYDVNDWPSLHVAFQQSETVLVARLHKAGAEADFEKLTGVPGSETGRRRAPHLARRRIGRWVRSAPRTENTLE
jgi:hypothetical protein